jgi:hypothetical protein
MFSVWIMVWPNKYIRYLEKQRPFDVQRFAQFQKEDDLVNTKFQAFVKQMAIYVLV